MTSVLLDYQSLYPADLNNEQLLTAVPDLTLYDETSPDEVISRIEHCEIVISNKVVITREHMAAAKRLKLICVAATGTNNIDIEAAKALGITVCNIQNYASTSVAEHVFGLIFALGRNLFAYHQSVYNGEWAQSPYFCLITHPIMELSGKTMGIVGYGALGQSTATMARNFGMKVLVSARPGSSDIPEGRVALDQLLAESDVVSLHCPLTSETADVIDAAALKTMKPNALLINTARGGIVNEEALLVALQQGQIAGAGFDVLTEEPPVNGNVLLEKSLPNLIITPHMAWGSQSARQTLIDQLADVILAWKQGDVINRVV